MITKQELAIILQDNGFTDTEIETILNKRIKKLLNAGQEQNIKEILKLLKKYRISKQSITKCLSILSRNRKRNDRKIFRIYIFK